MVEMCAEILGSGGNGNAYHGRHRSGLRDFSRGEARQSMSVENEVLKDGGKNVSLEIIDQMIACVLKDC